MGEVGEDVCELSPTVVHVELSVLGPSSAGSVGTDVRVSGHRVRVLKSGVPPTPMNTMSSLIPEFVSYL